MSLSDKFDVKGPCHKAVGISRATLLAVVRALKSLRWDMPHHENASHDTYHGLDHALSRIAIMLVWGRGT